MSYTQSLTVRKDRNVNPREYSKVFEVLLAEFVARVKQEFVVKEAVTGVLVGSGFRFVDEDMHIVCPWHGFEFNLRTGRHPGGVEGDDETGDAETDVLAGEQQQGDRGGRNRQPAHLAGGE